MQQASYIKQHFGNSNVDNAEINYRYSPGLCMPPAADDRPPRLGIELHRLPGDADNGGDAPITN